MKKSRELRVSLDRPIGSRGGKKGDVVKRIRGQFLYPVLAMAQTVD